MYGDAKAGEAAATLAIGAVTGAPNCAANGVANAAAVNGAATEAATNGAATDVATGAAIA